MKKGKRTTKSFSITVPAGFAPRIKVMADSHRRSISSYLSWLVEADVKRLNLKEKI